MSWYFTFRWQAETDQQRTRTVLVVSSISTPFDKTELRKAVDDDVRHNLLPDAIIVVVPTNESLNFAGRLREAVETETFLRTHRDRVPVYLAPFEQDGACSGMTRVSGPEAIWPADAFDRIRIAGLEEIFVKRQIVMRPGRGFHFVHPSGVHSLAFMRTANGLASGAEIDFMAMTLLGRLGRDVRQVWLDTSSIAVLVYAMISIKQRLAPGYTPPRVESFSSYGGLPQAGFTHLSRSLILISATASGNLARRIMGEEGIGKERVVTLFSAAERREDLNVLCDVSGHAETKGDHGQSLLQVVQPEQCQWCQNSSRLVHFVSDQFLADAIMYESVQIVATDAPRGLSDLAESYAQRRIFTLQGRGASHGHRFYLDLGPLGPEDQFWDEVRAATRRYAPVAASHVIYLDDDQSRAMGTVVHQEMRRILRADPILVSSRELEAIGGDARGAVIVAACIGSGNKLLEVSRDLRDILNDKPRAYLIGFAKQGDGTRYTALSNDLAYGVPFKHEVVALHKLVLPVADTQAWQREEVFWKRLRDHAQTASVLTEALELAGRRIAALSQPTFMAGDGLFLASPNGLELRISDGFAFWGFKYHPAEVAQGDVFMTIASVLHHMRTHRPKGGREPKLFTTAFNVTLIDPGMFGRFNDGVIQAALLRAAQPHELNYGGRADLSEMMLRILERTLRRWDLPQGEAALEFLVALGTGRLVLTATHAAELRNLQIEGSPNVVSALLDFVTQVPAS